MIWDLCTARIDLIMMHIKRAVGGLPTALFIKKTVWQELTGCGRMPGGKHEKKYLTGP